MSRTEPIHLIVNPRAARGRTARIAGDVLRLCAESGLEVRRHDTTAAGHATDLARGLDGAARIIAVLGGDGTLNEVVNGAQLDSSVLALIPSGTGNDFAKMLGVATARDGVALLARGAASATDLASVRIRTARGSEEERLFVNALGIGFDAAVAYRAARVRFGSGLVPYLLGVFSTLRSFRAANARIIIGDYQIETTLLLACIGNGRSSGGGFLLTPRAHIDDGLLDLCLVRNTPVRRILRVLPSTLRGGHLDAPEVRYEHARSVDVTLDRPLPVHADGELLAEDAVHVQVRVLPAAARFLRAE